MTPESFSASGARKQAEDRAAHLEEGDALGNAGVPRQAHLLVEAYRPVEIVDGNGDDGYAGFHYSPFHSGLRLSMKAPMPSSASRAIMFSTITCEA